MVLGLTCDPFMNEKDFDLYVHHSKVYQTKAFTDFPIPKSQEEFVSYKGRISKLKSKENFEKLHVSCLNGARWGLSRTFSLGGPDHSFFFRLGDVEVNFCL